ncbi:hypothetical protein DPMN_035837 [Dreissena polymorpha]|uniref:Uncharacterized protein n=1 Tax=Dreissena polymorpha TaxID=45954 RepID=A0A9D4M9K4_DREPO|nr:hypothetical protein DPMN_035837 [Dreissena polymorpha]
MAVSSTKIPFSPAPEEQKKKISEIWYMKMDPFILYLTLMAIVYVAGTGLKKLS